MENDTNVENSTKLVSLKRPQMSANCGLFGDILFYGFL